MRNFNFTKEEKAPYWEKAERMIQDSGLDLEIEYDSFGICKEGPMFTLNRRKQERRRKLYGSRLRSWCRDLLPERQQNQVTAQAARICTPIS